MLLAEAIGSNRPCTIKVQEGFRLRGVQPLSHTGELHGNGLSTNRIYPIRALMVPLVLN